MSDEQNLSKEEINAMLKALDEHITVPPIPPVETIFEKAEKETEDLKENKVFSFPKWIYAAGGVAAAVVIGLSVYPYLKGGLSRFEMKMADATEAVMENESYGIAAANGFESGKKDSFEEPAPEAEESESNSYTENDVDPDGTNGDAGKESPSETENESVLFDLLSSYYAKNGSFSYNPGVVTEAVNDFEITLGKKRSAEIDVSDDSVSVIVYDDSGERELLNAFWIEGTLLSYDKTDSLLTLEIDYVVTEKALSDGDFLPEISDENGIAVLSEDSIFHGETISEPVIHMTVMVNAENGTYVIEPFVS